MRNKGPGLFVAGTDTEVGKTYVAAQIARHLVTGGHRVGVYKPVASGCRREGDTLIADDALQLWAAAGRPLDLDCVCPQRFAAPLAPHVAARQQGETIDRDLLADGLAAWKDADVVIAEGVGGLLAPLTDEAYYVADLAKEIGYPLVVVARNALGTLNHTLLTLQVAADYGLPVAAVVLNDTAATRDESSASNRDELASRCGDTPLTTLGWQESTFQPQVDWARLASQVPRT